MFGSPFERVTILNAGSISFSTIKEEEIGWIGFYRDGDAANRNELKNRGVQDILIFSIDGFSGPSVAIQVVFPEEEI